MNKNLLRGIAPASEQQGRKLVMKDIRILAALVALASAGTASATQIEFDITGTINSSYVPDAAYIGQSASVHFFIDTDTFSLWSSDANGVSWSDLIPFDAPPAPIGASITLGGDPTISFNSQPGVYGGIGVTDVCRPDCPPYQGEGWNIVAISQSYPLFTNSWGNGYSTADLAFSSTGPAGVDFVDSSGLTPQDILTLPLGQLGVSYYRWDYTCVDGDCQQTREFMVQIDPTSVTRREVSTSVPEPGTLGLFAVALLGMGALGLRRAGGRA